MNRNDQGREARARDVIARRAAAAAERNARVFRIPPPNDREGQRFTWRSLASTGFRWDRVLVVVLTITMFVIFFSDPVNCSPESQRQKNADKFREAELEVQQSHGGLGPAQQKEL